MGTAKRGKSLQSKTCASGCQCSAGAFHFQPMVKRPRKHRPPHWRPRDAERRAYDKARGSAAERGYDRAWAKYSRAFLARNPVCRRCDELFGLSVSAAQTDHVKRHKGQRDPLFWDPKNHQPLCASCGATKSAHEARGIEFTPEHPYPGARNP